MKDAASLARNATSAATSSGPSQSAEGVLAGEEVKRRLVEVRLEQRRHDEAGADRVDPDVLCRILQRPVLVSPSSPCLAVT